jgi:hypothetical protein
MAYKSFLGISVIPTPFISTIDIQFSTFPGINALVITNYNIYVESYTRVSLSVFNFLTLFTLIYIIGLNARSLLYT